MKKSKPRSRFAKVSTEPSTKSTNVVTEAFNLEKTTGTSTENPVKSDKVNSTFSGSDPEKERENGRESVPLSMSASQDAKESLVKVAKVTEPEFRLACNEIAEELAKNWSFLWKVLASMAALAAVAVGLLGWTIRDMATSEIEKAKVTIDATIADEFKDAKIKKVVENVASDQAATLLQQHVQPSIDQFNKHLKSQTDVYDKEVADLKAEMKKLKARNELTALADAAISRGDVHAYRQLRVLGGSDGAPDDASAEFIRVFEIFSILAPTRFNNIKMKVELIHPGYTQEDQLGVDDLLPLLGAPEAALRARVAQLLAIKGKPGSYRTAKNLAEAIGQKPNLWVMRSLKLAFAHEVSLEPLRFVDEGGTGSPDGQNAFLWWNTHELEVKSADTDPKLPTNTH